jgi:hypothetical protein
LWNQISTPVPENGEVMSNQAVVKYADSIIQWGGVFRTIFTVLGWIYLVIGGILGFYYGQNMYGNPFLFLILGLILGALGTLTMFGYRLFFDYLLMRALTITIKATILETEHGGFDVAKTSTKERRLP